MWLGVIPQEAYLKLTLLSSTVVYSKKGRLILSNQTTFTWIPN